MINAKAVIDDIIIWIDINIEKPLRIDDVVVMSGYSRRHLQRIFFQVMNVNIAQYIRDKKLMLAAKDLKESNASVISIAERYGFGSLHAFTHVFSKKYKLPPSRYRLQNRNIQG